MRRATRRIVFAWSTLGPGESELAVTRLASSGHIFFRRYCYRDRPLTALESGFMQDFIRPALFLKAPNLAPACPFTASLLRLGRRRLALFCTTARDTTSRRNVCAADIFMVTPSGI